MKLRTYGYFAAESVRGLVRNSLMSVTSTATVAASVFIVIFSFLIATDIDYTLERLEQSVGISAIVEDNLHSDDIAALYEAILEIPFVANVEYISSEHALELFSEQLGDEGILSGFKEDNPLPRSFTVTLNDIRNSKDVISALKSSKFEQMGVIKVREAQEVTELLATLNSMIRIVSIAIVALLTALSMIIVMNTIKLTVNSRRNEIGIMKFVGATDSFIKAPFFLEGMFIGIIGSVIPAVICYFSYGAMTETLSKKYALISEVLSFGKASEMFVPLTIIAVFFGALIGTLGSVSSVRKYLNV